MPPRHANDGNNCDEGCNENKDIHQNIHQGNNDLVEPVVDQSADPMVVVTLLEVEVFTTGELEHAMEIGQEVMVKLLVPLIWLKNC